jgi:hypothetical protein
MASRLVPAPTAVPPEAQVAGTYNIGIVCTGNGTRRLNNATMNVLAVAASS